MMKNCIKFHLLSKRTVFLKLLCFAVFCTYNFYFLDGFAQSKKQIVVRGKVVNPKGEATTGCACRCERNLGICFDG